MRQTSLEVGSEMPNPVEVERTLEHLKIERECPGAINLSVEEEQKELSERLLAASI